MRFDLEHINVLACPECGCHEIKSIYKSNQHYNEGWNESIEFKCGYTKRYIPHSNSTEIVSECKNCDGYSEKIKKRRNAKKSLSIYIKKMKVDDDFKDRILRDIAHTMECF